MKVAGKQYAYIKGKYIMDMYTAVEQAYKNGHTVGYKEAVKEFVEELKEEMWQMCVYEDTYISYPFTFVDKVADKLVKKIGKH